VTITLPPTTTPTAEPPPRPPSSAPATGRLGDRVFSGLSTGAGILILVVLALVALFLVTESIPALTADARTCPAARAS
jgi:phosphate transport system permease protein